MMWPFAGISKAGSGTFHLHGQEIDVLDEVETCVRARIREYKGLEAVEVSRTNDPEEDEGEEHRDSASFQPGTWRATLVL